MMMIMMMMVAMLTCRSPSLRLQGGEHRVRHRRRLGTLAFLEEEEEVFSLRVTGGEQGLMRQCGEALKRRMPPAPFPRSLRLARVAGWALWRS